MRLAFLSLSTLAALALALPALAETKSLNLAGFSKLEVSAAMEVVVKQGPFSVKVDEPRGDFDHLRIEIKGDTLVVSRKSETNWHGPGPDYTVVVTAPSLKEIVVTSASSVEGKDLKLKELKLDVNSGARLRLSGGCSAMTLAVSSGARFEGEDLKCETASVAASSGASAEAFAAKTASGEASSGARVVFYGKPATISKAASTGGEVKSF